jgi:RNA polymerase sigma-70 factor (ECF subfamily)
MPTTLETAMNRDSSEYQTSLSLLDRLKLPQHESAEAWRHLHDLYTPLIQSWLRRVPDLPLDKVGDLNQEVFLILVSLMPSFERQRLGSFRAWLREITVNRIRAFWKERRRRPLTGFRNETESFLAQLEDPTSALAQQWDREHDQQVVDQLLALVKNDFVPLTWEAFTPYALANQSAAQVAQAPGLTPDAVISAKARILRRLREERMGLLD